MNVNAFGSRTKEKEVKREYPRAVDIKFLDPSRVNVNYVWSVCTAVSRTNGTKISKK